jgi:regulatory protein
VKASRKPRRALPPLNRNQLKELALKYVGRFATSRARLRVYLARKIRERGWDEASAPDLEALADRFAELGYVDDSAFALGKARSLTGRGYGKRRVVEQLRVAGIEERHGAAACEHADEQAVAAALRFAERRKLGPFALAPSLDRNEREKAIGAMVRAGHGFAIARAITALPPGGPIELDALAEKAGLNTN